MDNQGPECASLDNNFLSSGRTEIIRLPKGSESLTGQKRHNASLDGLRGVAAAAVVWYHMTGQAYGTNNATPYRGYLAVDFFFILSGLVVARAYESRLRNGMSFTNFAIIRLTRLYPLILLGIFCGFLSKLFSFHFHNIYDVLRAVPFALVLLPYSGMYGPARDVFPLDPPIWSLMFELWANFIYAFVAVRSAKMLRPVIISAIILGGVALITCAIAGGGLNGGYSIITFWTGVARVAFAFSAGIGLNCIITPARIARMPSVPFPVLAAGLLLALSAGPWFGPLYDVFAVLLIFPSIVALGTKDCASPRWRSVALRAGALSYPVYILHEATFAHFTHFQGHSATTTIMLFVAAFMAIILVSYVALRWYDEPVRRRLGWWSSGR